MKILRFEIEKIYKYFLIMIHQIWIKIGERKN